MPLASQFRVVYAILLHDIKSRYFGNGLGQILLLFWPFTHLAFLVGAYALSGRVAPFGNSLLLFACTGVIPWIIFSYMSRWIVYAPTSNRPLLNYPCVMPFDLCISRAALEIVNSLLMVCLSMIMLRLLDDDPWPVDVSQAAEALGVCIALALALGIFNGAIVFITNLWVTVYVLVLIPLYIVSGTFFVPATLPAEIRYILSFNPALQVIEWMRCAYYPDYPSTVLDKAYVVEFTFVTLALGLLLQRVARRLKSNF